MRARYHRAGNRIAGAKPAAIKALAPHAPDPDSEVDDLSAIGRHYKSPKSNGAKNPWQK